MAHVENRLVTIKEAAELADCVLLDLLELGARGEIPILAYVAGRTIMWCTYEHIHPEPSGIELEEGYFALEPEEIRTVFDKGVTTNPWIIRDSGNRREHGCLSPKEGQPWKVAVDDLRVSPHVLQQVKERAVGDWLGIVGVDPGLSRREQGRRQTKARNHWIFKRAEELEASGMTPKYAVARRIVDELPDQFKKKNPLTPERVQRIWSEVKGEMKIEKRRL